MIEEHIDDMERDVFDTIYETLMANNWRYAQRDDGMTPDLYYAKLKGYRPKDVLDAVLGFIDKEEQKSPPSIGEMRAALRQITEGRETDKSCGKNRDGVFNTVTLLKQCVREARTIIDENSKGNGVHKVMSAEGRQLLKECGKRYEGKAKRARVEHTKTMKGETIKQRGLGIS